MKKAALFFMVFCLNAKAISNPITADDFLYMEEEQVWIEVGPESSSVSGTFFFKLGKHAKSMYTFYVPVYVPNDWDKEQSKKETKLQFTVKNTLITKKIIEKRPDKVKKELLSPGNQKVAWFEIKTTEFIGAKTAGVEFPDKNDKTNVIHGKQGKFLWRDKDSSIPPIKISYNQQNYKEKNGSYFIYMPLISNTNPDAKDKEYGFIRLRPQKGHKIELVSELPNGSWKKVDGDILVSPRNRKAIIVKVFTNQ